MPWGAWCVMCIPMCYKVSWRLHIRRKFFGIHAKHPFSLPWFPWQSMHSMGFHWNRFHGVRQNPWDFINSKEPHCMHGFNGTPCNGIDGSSRNPSYSADLLEFHVIHAFYSTIPMISVDSMEFRMLRNLWKSMEPLKFQGFHVILWDHWIWLHLMGFIDFHDMHGLTRFLWNSIHSMESLESMDFSRGGWLYVGVNEIILKKSPPH